MECCGGEANLPGKTKSSVLSMVQGKWVLEKFWWEVKLWVETAVVLSRKLEMTSRRTAALGPRDRSHVTCHRGSPTVWLLTLRLLSCFIRVQLFVTPWTATRQASLSTGAPQARTPGWVAMSSSRGSSWPRDRTGDSCLAGRFFTTEPPGKLQPSG